MHRRENLLNYFCTFNEAIAKACMEIKQVIHQFNPYKKLFQLWIEATWLFFPLRSRALGIKQSQVCHTLVLHIFLQ